MKKLKMLILSFMLLLVPMISLGATGHVNGCTNTSFDTNCCTKTFKITAQSGYTVTDVIVNGVSQGAITSYTFSNITGPQTLKVITTATSVGSTGGSTGGTSSTTNSDCVILVDGGGNTVGVTVKMNGTTLDPGQHIVPYGTTLTTSVFVSEDEALRVDINDVCVFEDSYSSGGHKTYNYTVTSNTVFRRFSENEGETNVISIITKSFDFYI